MQFFCTMPTFVYADYHRHHRKFLGFLLLCLLCFVFSFLPSFHPFANSSSLSVAEMLAGRGLPTVPEEDFFPEVEETAGLPPSSSPPSVSTPTPTTHLEFTSRQTAVHPYDEPQSPQLYSHQDTFIPSQSHHSSPNTGAASPILTTLQLRQEGSSEKHGFARRTGTTTSPHIRLESPDERIPERKISPPSLHSSSSSSESFAVPKVKYIIKINNYFEADVRRSHLSIPFFLSLLYS
ncbi:UNVERIFIED_CONTAM: hypothetical protein RMT77_014710 [Armadillidium vulgare]